MYKTKREKLKAVKALFQKHKVLKIEELSKVIGTTSRRTVHRYIKELEYLTSYSHKGRYYTLLEIAEFDSNGLWHFEDVGFSKHGTLFETITYFVNQSEAGLTSNELQSHSQTVVKHALIDLVEKEKVSRARPGKVYVYLSSDPVKAQKQLQERECATSDQLIDQGIALRVLLAAYQIVAEFPTPDQVVNVLQKDGSKISSETVQKVFRQYKLEKKTSDSSLSHS
jgi:predicted transcriptional regulator